MEADREFVSFRDAGQDTQPVLGRALGLLRTLASTAVEDAAVFGFSDAADFAAEVEDLSRTVEYLQLVAAGAVDRTRHLPPATAAAAAPVDHRVAGRPRAPAALRGRLVRG